jgi:hypothetical protein
MSIDWKINYITSAEDGHIDDIVTNLIYIEDIPEQVRYQLMLYLLPAIIIHDLLLNITIFIESSSYGAKSAQDTIWKYHENIYNHCQ